MPSRLTGVRLETRRLLLALGVAVAISGASCRGGCSDLTPLPGSFDPTQRVENAGALRITPAGLDFIGQHLGVALSQAHGGDLLEAPVAPATLTASGINLSLCPAGPDPTASPPSCELEIDLAGVDLALTTSEPSGLRFEGTVPVRMRLLPMHVTGGCYPLGCVIDADVTAALNGDGACPGGTFEGLPVDARFTIQVDRDPGHPSGVGYSMVTVTEVVDQNALNTNLSNHLSFCGGIMGSILDPTRGLLIPQLSTTFRDALTAAVESLVCTKADALTPCPPGSTEDGNGYCRYATNACASNRIGIEGRLTSGASLLGALPGTHGSLDLLASAGGTSPNTDRDPASNTAWGDLNPVNGGAALSLVGGATPAPPSACVTPVDMALPTDIPVPDDLYSNAVANWPSELPAPHFGFALSERWLDYALAAAFDAGLLCARITTREDPRLDSTALAAIAPSAQDLGLQGEAQGLALELRPSAPPSLLVGNGTDPATDPALRLTWPRLTADLYMGSMGRYTWVLGVTQDLEVALQLEPVSGGLRPTVVGMTGTNPQATTTPLLAETPDALAAPAAALVRTALTAWLQERLVPWDLTVLAPPGLTVTLPDQVPGQGSPGLRRLTKKTDAFLGIFGYYDVAPAHALVAPPTHAAPPHVPAGAATGPAAPPAPRGPRGPGLPGAALALGLMVVGCGLARRARVALLLLAVAGAALTAGCGGNSSATGQDAGLDAYDAGPSADTAVPPGDDAASAPDAAGPEDASVPPTALQPGIVGAYTSTTFADGQLWVAGYAERDPASGRSWGDLVVGTWDGTRVEWRAIDGVPATPPVDSTAFDTSGFRGGQTAPGDDVGLFTSMGTDAAGRPAVTYYDRTNRALKLARYDGAAWTVGTLETRADLDVGRYGKLVVAGARWLVAYQTRSALAGATRAAVRLASAAEVAGLPLSWSFEDVAVDETAPCEAALCPAGEVCAHDDARCVAPLAADLCAPACGTGRACVDRGGEPRCVLVVRTEDGEGPAALGSGLALAALPGDGVGVVYRDGKTGELLAAQKTNGAWTTTPIVTGPDEVAGLGHALAVDPGGDWHVVYRDVAQRRVMYLQLTGGTTPATRAVLDDGSGIAGGGHWLGADPALALAGGEVRASYQDATAGTLRYAVAPLQAGVPGSWTTVTVAQVGWAGAFSQLVDDNGAPRIVNWRRHGSGPSAAADVVVVQP